MSRIQHETQLGKLASIEQRLSSLSLPHSVVTVTTVSKEPTDTQNHIAALRAETTRVDQTIEDPLFRLGFAVGSEKAVHQIQSKIETTDSADAAYDNKVTSSPSGIIKPEEAKNFPDAKLQTKWIWSEWNTTNFLFGTIHTSSTTRQLQSSVFDDQQSEDEEHQYEHQSSFTIRPAAWLVNLGFNSGLRVGLFNSSVRGWRSSLDAFCAVPDDSPIFELSRDGNLSAVRALFSRGLASVRDTNSFGETPLHVRIVNPELAGPSNVHS